MDRTRKRPAEDDGDEELLRASKVPVEDVNRVGQVSYTCSLLLDPETLGIVLYGSDAQYHSLLDHYTADLNVTDDIQWKLNEVFSVRTSSAAERKSRENEMDCSDSGA